MEYAVFHWPEHSRYASDAIEHMFDFSGPFCQKGSRIRENWWELYCKSRTGDSYNVPRSLALMHLAARFGITPLARKLITEKKLRYMLPFQNPGNVRDCYGRTPLSWAAKSGHEAVVKMLLEKRANVNAIDRWRRTALHWAAENGHEAVVSLLLEGGANIEKKDDSYGTPLASAVGTWSEAVIKLLLAKGANVNFKYSINVSNLIRTEQFPLLDD